MLAARQFDGNEATARLVVRGWRLRLVVARLRIRVVHRREVVRLRHVEPPHESQSPPPPASPPPPPLSQPPASLTPKSAPPMSELRLRRMPSSIWSSEGVFMLFALPSKPAARASPW